MLVVAAVVVVVFAAVNKMIDKFLH